MKKFFLVLICAVIILFFIGFNYLLWDRENKAEDIKTLKNTNDSNDVTINYLSKEMKRLNDENEGYVKELDRLTKDIELLNKKVNDSAMVNSELKKELSSKEESIGFLKDGYDNQALAAIINGWVENLNEGNFFEAYEIRFGHGINSENGLTLEAFTLLFKGIVKQIAVESIDEHMGEDIKANGQKAFNVVLEAVVDETVENTYFTNGKNSRIFVMDFDRSTSNWVITDIMQQD